jgi:hypothetical protein
LQSFQSLKSWVGQFHRYLTCRTSNGNTPRQRYSMQHFPNLFHSRTVFPGLEFQVMNLLDNSSQWAYCCWSPKVACSECSCGLSTELLNLNCHPCWVQCVSSVGRTGFPSRADF